ncbi:MAG: hypothetical protein PVG61_01350 [Dehalococcoidia bacterium]|jgi:hypothetical protein
MKRLVTAVAIMFVAVLFTVVGCTNTDMIGPSPGEDQGISNSCLTCHTDKTVLKEVASPETAEQVSEETSGEG